jgi:hypothetical protein
MSLENIKQAKPIAKLRRYHFGACQTASHLILYAALNSFNLNFTDYFVSDVTKIKYDFSVSQY